MGTVGFLCGVLPAEEATSVSNAAKHEVATRHVTTGPWGTIESFPVTLEPPASHLWAALYDERSYWNFGTMEKPEARALLVTLGLSQETLALIDVEGVWKSTDSGLDLDFGDNIVESLTPENRAALARWFRLDNPFFFTKAVINFEGGDFSAFENNGIASSTLALVKKMSFTRRNVLSIMDLPYILRQLGGDVAEKERFLRSTFATRGLIARLVIDESSKLDEIIDYWSGDGLNPGIASILRGVQATDGINRLDLVQLLPPVPRRYLYGFTNLRDVSPLNTPDCFWTSVQFFQHNASARLLDPLRLMHHIETDFERVPGSPRFGDLVCMFDEDDGAFVHSFVHIADDIVFSKNGASFARPFVLTRKSDMLSVYLDESRYREEIYRRKREF